MCQSVAPEEFVGLSAALVRRQSGAGGTDKIFLMVSLHFLALKAQLVVLVSAFLMVSTVWSVSCLLFFYSRCPRVQPFVKLGGGGGRGPVPCRHWWQCSNVSDARRHSGTPRLTWWQEQRSTSLQNKTRQAFHTRITLTVTHTPLRYAFLAFMISLSLSLSLSLSVCVYVLRIEMELLQFSLEICNENILMVDLLKKAVIIVFQICIRLSVETVS